MQSRRGCTRSKRTTVRRNTPEAFSVRRSVHDGSSTYLTRLTSHQRGSFPVIPPTAFRMRLKPFFRMVMLFNRMAGPTRTLGIRIESGRARGPEAVSRVTRVAHRGDTVRVPVTVLGLLAAHARTSPGPRIRVVVELDGSRVRAVLPPRELERGSGRTLRPGRANGRSRVPRFVVSRRLAGIAVRHGCLQGPRPNEQAFFEAWRAQFDWMHEHVDGGIFTLTMHPQITGVARVRNISPNLSITWRRNLT